MTKTGELSTALCIVILTKSEYDNSCICATVILTLTFYDIKCYKIVENTI